MSAARPRPMAGATSLCTRPILRCVRAIPVYDRLLPDRNQECTMGRVSRKYAGSRAPPRPRRDRFPPTGDRSQARPAHLAVERPRHPGCGVPDLPEQGRLLPRRAGTRIEGGGPARMYEHGAEGRRQRRRAKALGARGNPCRGIAHLMFKTDIIFIFIINNSCGGIAHLIL